jgi:hemolysin activation/secretion protein
MQKVYAGLLIGSVIAWAGAASAQDQPSYSSTDPTAAVPSTQETSSPLETVPSSAEAMPTSSEAPLFVLTSVRFTGAAAVPEGRLDAAWRPYAGREVSFDDLRRIGRAAELIYAQAGYPFVAVVLTPQQVTGGAVEYRVVEGHISDLTVLGLDPVARRQVTGAFGPLVGRSPLPLSDVEAAYHGASEIPGLSLAGSLRRGSEPGGMDLVIQARRRTWRAYANINNYYSDPVGPWGVVLGVEYNGASAWGDRTTLQLYTTTDVPEQEVVKLSHWRGLPQGFSVEVGFTRAWAEPQGAVAQLDLATDVTLGYIEVGKRLYSRGRFTLNGTVGFEGTDQETRVFNNLALTEDRLRIATLGVDWNWHRARFTTDGSLQLRQGFDGLGASRRGDADLSRLDADPQALVVRGSAKAQLEMRWGWGLSATVLGQYSPSSLAAPEEFSAGNLTIGRGYLPGAAYGDSAVAGAFELWLPPVRMPRGVSVRPFAYYDVVRVWNAEFGAPDDHTLASAGGGLRLDVEGRFRVDLTLTRPLDPPLGLGEPRPGPYVLLNVTVGIPDAFRGISRLFRRESRS